MCFNGFDFNGDVDAGVEKGPEGDEEHKSKNFEHSIDFYLISADDCVDLFFDLLIREYFEVDD